MYTYPKYTIRLTTYWKIVRVHFLREHHTKNVHNPTHPQPLTQHLDLLRRGRTAVQHIPTIVHAVNCRSIVDESHHHQA